MVFVNTTVFSSFSSLKSTNQIHAATENNDINYTYGILPSIFCTDPQSLVAKICNLSRQNMKLID